MKNILQSISLPSLFGGIAIGFIIGVLSLALLVNYLISNAIKGDSTSALFLGSAIEQVRQGITVTNVQKAATSVYGKVTAIGAGTLTLEVYRPDGTQSFTFVFDDKTTIVKLAADAESTQIPLSSDDIEIGAGLTVSTNEPAGSIENQYAVKIVQI